MVDPIRIEPAPGENYPGVSDPTSRWTIPGRPHDPLCRCTECWETKKKNVPLAQWPAMVIVPWMPQSAAHRGKEPVARLEYGGVRVEIGLTLLQALTSIVYDRHSTFEGALGTLSSALSEIEQRMWKALDEKRKAAVDA